jgi:hypothetical protein
MCGMEMKSRPGGVDPLAEPQDDALFVRLHPINPGRQPVHV